MAVFVRPGYHETRLGILLTNARERRRQEVEPFDWVDTPEEQELRRRT